MIREGSNQFQCDITGGHHLPLTTEVLSVKQQVACTVQPPCTMLQQ